MIEEEYLQDCERRGLTRIDILRELIELKKGEKNERNM